MTEKPLLERLVDFDNYGNKAMERYSLRMQAYEEIKRLQGLLAYGTNTDEYRRLRAENEMLKSELRIIKRAYQSFLERKGELI